MIVGEFGPVELELVIAFIIFMGGYLGAEKFQLPVADTIGVERQEMPSMIQDLQWSQVVGGLFVPLILLFVWENLGDCLYENPRKTGFYFLPAIVTFALTAALCWTEQYV